MNLYSLMYPQMSGGMPPMQGMNPQMSGGLPPQSGPQANTSGGLPPQQAAPWWAPQHRHPFASMIAANGGMDYGSPNPMGFGQGRR